jgi:exodeoxyribonuclease VII large subunit
MKVLMRGNITVYERRGEYQCICDYIEPMGSGALQMAFEQMKKRLDQEGLFDAEHKRPIPIWPKRIGIVTSPTGAAIQDILTILTRRFTTFEVVINPVRVQGEGAAQEIARAIKELEGQPYIEVIIVTRGGGSLEDLWAFNEEIVARALYSCRVPVISAVGHEIDYTISDFVADLRAPTPSAAAELVIQNREWLEGQLSHLQNRLLKATTHEVDLDKMRLLHLTGVKIFSDPRIIIREKQEYIDELESRLLRALSYSLERLTEKIKNITKLLQMLHPAEKIQALLAKTSDNQERLVAIFDTYIQNRRHSFTTLIAYLNALSPLNILQRGYSLCWKLPEEKVIRGDTEIEVGDSLRLKFYQGGALCEVKNKGEL